MLMLGGYLFDYLAERASLPSRFLMVGLCVNVVMVAALLCVAARLPINIPPPDVAAADIGKSVSPEDYTSFWGAVTFNWIYPLIRHGTNATLNEADVWPLSLTLQSRPVFAKFSTLQHGSLLRRIWATAYQDLALDFIGTLFSIVFSYGRPFFLKRLLDSIDHPNATTRDQGIAYIFAAIILVCSVLQAEASAQHLSYCRHAATRVRSELMAAIYDKALKRKDASGIVNREKATPRTSAPTPSVSGAATPYAKDSIQPPKSQVNTMAKDQPQASADPGTIVNLMSGDCSRISGMITMLYTIYGAPFEIVFGSLFLYQLLGWSAFTGFVVVLMGWPLNKYVTERNVRLHRSYLKARDKRVGVLDEMISSIKFIKFFAWEDRWMEKAMNARADEMEWLSECRMNIVMFYGLWNIAPVSLSLISFATYVWLGNQLTVGTAFAASLFLLTPQFERIIPSALRLTWTQARIALDRIAAFLNEDEVSDQVSSLKSPDPNFDHEEGLGLDDASFRWNEGPNPANPKKLSDPRSTDRFPSNLSDSTSIAGDDRGSEFEVQRFELRSLSVKFPEKKLSVITGPTASGKTALLMALLGEMTLVSGRLIMLKDNTLDEHGNIRGIAYAAQSPWLRHQSIRDNILFGYPYDESRYTAVIECCALRPDLDMLEDGDATEIGVKGVTLSGGQKARVALARAVYSRKKYVLLDDPLSAVDTDTARTIYHKCLRGSLLKNRTVILVTHHVKLVLPGAHYFVQMEDGRIAVQGTVADLRSQGILEGIARTAALDGKRRQSIIAAEALIGAKVAPAEVKEPRKLVKEEHRETGSVKFSVYKAYIAAGGYPIWILLALITLIRQLRNLGEKVWIKVWTDAYTPIAPAMSSQTSRGMRLLAVEWPNAAEHPMFYIGIYAALGLFSVAMSLVNVGFAWTAALNASRILFRKLLVTVVRATFRFHDTTPQGRLMNRFSKDFETVDSAIAMLLQAVNYAIAEFFVSLMTVAYIFPPFLLPASIIGYFYRIIAIGYLRTGRDLRRMESNTRSPIFSEFGELLAGIVTVRAFSAEKRFMDNLHGKIDETSKIGYAFWMSNRWLSFNFDALGALTVFITALFAVTFLHNDAGLAGVVITSALSFGNSVYTACRFWTSLELDLNAVERIIEYLDLPQDPPAIVDSQRPPAYWPSSSNNEAMIAVENLVVRYAPDLPPVLKGVSFQLKAGERVGLVGRTGIGKSTLAMSLLRFVDPSEGKIIIDGIDISSIGTYDLRSRITFIPQDSLLVSGSLRDNLDPFGEFDDTQCMDVLHRTNLIPHSTSRPHSRAPSPLPSRSHSPLPLTDDATMDDTDAETAVTALDVRTTVSLDMQVSAGGANFSQGQRQLIAIARALLRHSTIVVLDEATSSVDFATDAQIQKVIREEFHGSTLITVAHRLRTIIDYDRIVVLEKGKVAEIDAPLNLLRRQGGIFRDMCLKSGYFGELESAAQAKVDA
ncbi:hypothetical protein FB451DRAFT_1445526 [Mycena latifolia]|nr:hypothetical protein FB451DRAFT_1445526 [Mycena latifolia]